MELIYFGKAYFKVHHKSKMMIKLLPHQLDDNEDDIKEARVFIIRRKRHLEMMYTNGTLYWTSIVDGSQINYPYYIQDAIMSPDNTTLLAYCSVETGDA